MEGVILTQSKIQVMLIHSFCKILRNQTSFTWCILLHFKLLSFLYINSPSSSSSNERFGSEVSDATFQL